MKTVKIKAEPKIEDLIIESSIGLLTQSPIKVNAKNIEASSLAANAVTEEYYFGKKWAGIEKVGKFDRKEVAKAMHGIKILAKDQPGVLLDIAFDDKTSEVDIFVCSDDEGSIYVAQWASGKVYPYKFTRV